MDTILLINGKTTRGLNCSVDFYERGSIDVVTKSHEQTTVYNFLAKSYSDDWIVAENNYQNLAIQKSAGKIVVSIEDKE